MEKVDKLRLFATGVVLMFVFSGLMKVCTFLGYCMWNSQKPGHVSEAERFSKRTGVCLPNSARLVFLAGLVELFGAFLILRGVWSSKMNLTDVRKGSHILAGFTVLATLIFYTYPFRPIPFFSNVTTATAVLLLPMACGS